MNYKLFDLNSNHENIAISRKNIIVQEKAYKKVRKEKILIKMNTGVRKKIRGKNRNLRKI